MKFIEGIFGEIFEGILKSTSNLFGESSKESAGEASVGFSEWIHGRFSEKIIGGISTRICEAIL